MIKVGIECESIEDSQTWGVARQINELLRELAEHPELGNEFKFFLYFKEKIPVYSYLNSPLFVKKIIRLPFLPASFSLYYYIFLPLKLYFDKLDIAYFPNYMLPLIFRSKTLVVLSEDIYHEMTSGTLPWRYRLAYRIFAVRAAKHATGIIAMSDSSKLAIAQFFKIPNERIFVNHLGLNLPSPLSDSGPETKKLVASDYLLYVGQAFPRRHLRETILAFEKIADQFPNTSLVAIGKDKYNPPVIRKLVGEVNSRLGRKVIIYKDYVDNEDLVALYRGAKVLVYISVREAFGLPPLEALGYGIPAVAGRSGAMEELVQDAAFYVSEPISVESIADSLTNALTDESRRQQIAHIGPERIKVYSWAKNAERFLRIVKKTVNGQTS